MDPWEEEEKASSGKRKHDDENKEEKEEEEAREQLKKTKLHNAPLVIVPKPYDITDARNNLRLFTKWWSNDLAKLMVPPKTWLWKNRKQEQCFPPQELVFDALIKCPDPAQIKVIIYALDPYTHLGEACGLAFGLIKNHKLKRLPSSLINILEEARRKEPCLDDWAAQHVLLLNATLTVDAEGESNTHKGIGWKPFTEHVMITALEANRAQPPVCMGWGIPAWEALQHIKNITGIDFPLLSSTHPSGRSYKMDKSRLPPFYKNGHFMQCNKILTDRGQTPIDWAGH